MNIYQIKVSRFASYKANRTDGQINLWNWLLKENEYTPTVYKIRSMTDEAEIRDLKSGLPAVTISCICERRRNDDILEHTGLICIDIDGKDNPGITDMELLKSRLSALGYILYCGLSVSGRGLFCIIPIAAPRMHKQHFYALERNFKEMGIVIDPACHDVCRLRGYSYDDKPYVNPEAQTYEETFQRTFMADKKTGDEYLSDKKFKEPQQRGKPLENIPLIMAPLLEMIELNGIDITGNCKRWFSIGCALAGEYGEEGRYIFHAVSKYYHTSRYKYTEDETNGMYDSCLQSWHRYNYGIGSFYYWMKEYGIL